MNRLFLCVFIIRQKKGPDGPVGIKNSWKYEKDLIILNETNSIFTINQVSYIYVVSYYPL